MAKWKHRISNVNEVEKTADCAHCGRVPVKFKRDKQRWVCRLRMRELRKLDTRTDGVQWRRKQEFRDKFVAELKAKGCVFCGYDRCPHALHFHHVDPKLKEFTVSQRMIPSMVEILLEEIAKCIVVCSNCHIEIHRGYIPHEKVLQMFQLSSTAERGAVNTGDICSNQIVGAKVQ